jgi:hypothetical protein
MEDQSQEETDESVYQVLGSKLEALIVLGRMVYVRGYSYIPDAELLKVVGASMKMRDALDISKAIRIGALTYYVRATTAEEMRSWLRDELAQDGDAGIGSGGVGDGGSLLDPEQQGSGQPGT